MEQLQSLANIVQAHERLLMHGDERKAGLVTRMELAEQKIDQVAADIQAIKAFMRSMMITGIGTLLAIFGDILLRLIK